RPRTSGGRDQHRGRLPRLLVPSIDRTAHGVSAGRWQAATRMRTLAGAAIASIGLACVCALAAAQRRGPEVTLFEGARIITGDGRAIETGAMLVENDTIARVGRKGDVAAP